jgi:glycosyltransferase involved in cell wall biosynthesis
VGRLEPWKGQEVFLQAAARIAERCPDARFAVVGSAITDKLRAYPDQLERLAATLGLADRVHFAGHVDDTAPWFDALDVCVHATHGEPFGLVVVEAMAVATPVVATALGGPTEIVEHGTSGLLVPPGEPEPLADAVASILADERLAARLADGGAQRASRFSDDRMAAGFAAVLDGVLGEAA